MAVRTGGPGAAGLSVLVVPLKGHPGVSILASDPNGNNKSLVVEVGHDDTHAVPFFANDV
jgi:acyl-CoA dehydrogenase